MGRELITADAVALEPHVYDPDGICYLCDYENLDFDQPCPHPEKYVSYDSLPDYEQYISYDSEYHTHRWTDRAECIVCREWLTDLNKDYTEKKPHTNVDGRCPDCRYSFACVHAMATSSRGVDDITTVTAYDGTLHMYEGVYIEVLYCTECWSRFDTRVIDENYTWFEEHDFSNGSACADCGYAPECAHPEESRETVDAYGMAATVSTTPEQHTIWAELFREEKCLECGLMLSRILVSDGEITGPHTFDENGYCGICGYTFECAHEGETTTVIDDASLTITRRDESGHTGWGTIYEKTFCGDCGFCFARALLGEEVEYTGEHTYKNGVCTVCGYYEENCPHPEVFRSSRMYFPDPQITPYNNKYHTVSGEYWRQVDCGLCGGIADDYLVDADYKKRSAHKVNENGACTECFFSDFCDHNEEVLSYGVTFANTGYEPYDDNDHTFFAQKIKTTYCNNCDIIVRRELVDANYTALKPHDYGYDGSCTVCGHVPGCGHPEDMCYDVVWVNPSVINDVTLTHHTITGDRCRIVVCDACGGELLSEVLEENVTETAEHVFDENDVCQICNFALADVTPEPTGMPDIPDEPDTTEEPGLTPEPTGTPDIPDEPDTTEEPELTPAPSGMPDTTDGPDSGECVHEPVESTFWDNDKYDSIDGKRHYIYGDKYTIVSCSICLEEISRELVEAGASEIQDHWYDGGDTCVSCGYVNACEHPADSRSTITWIEDDKPVSIDEYTHMLTGERWQEVTCRDCGTMLSSGVIENEASEPENHKFAEGVCVKCGYEQEVACTHPAENLKEYPWPNNADYDPIDVSYHSVTGELWKDVVCSLCSYSESVLVEEDYSATERHTMRDGVCIHCKYENYCEHPESSRGAENKFIDPEYSEYDEYMHNVTGDLWCYPMCNDCGMELTPYQVGENITEQRDHELENGVCSLCGYEEEAICNHVADAESSVVDYNDIGYKPIDDATHYMLANETVTSYCIICREMFVAESRVSEIQKHVFVDGKCRDCDYDEPVTPTVAPTDEVDECKHENVTAVNDFVEPFTTEVVDGMYHSITGDLWSYPYCTDCGAEFMPYLAVSGYTENREHEMENGVCSICGYTAETEAVVTPAPEPTPEPAVETTPEPTVVPAVCEHTAQSTVYEESTGYHQFSPDEHLYKYMLMKTVTCDTCGAETFYGVDEQSTTREAHTMENGVCIKCSFSTVCEHTNTYSGCDKLVTAYTPVDADFHNNTGLLYEYTVCLDCNSNIAFRAISEEYTSLERHAFNSDGVCEYCRTADTNACEHPESGYVVSEYYMDSVTSDMIIASDETTHTLVACMMRSTRCGLCGYEISLEDCGEKQFVVKHYYETDGKCVCGHENACGHESGETYTKYTTLHESVVGTSYTHHIVDCWLVGQIFCADCHQPLTGHEELGYRESFEAAHIFSYGRCNICGYADPSVQPELEPETPVE